MGFVVASPQNLPALCVDVAHTFNDGIVLDASARLVDRNTLRIQRNRNLVGIGIAWNRRLEDARNTVTGFRNHLKLGRHLRRHILSGHGFAWVDDVESTPATNIQLAVKDWLLQHCVVVISSLELDQEVNAVHRGRLPLVDGRPRITLAFGKWSHRRGARRED